MIFITTGTHTKGFERLVEAGDDLAAMLAGEEVIIQTGISAYKPIHATSVEFMTNREMEAMIEQARIIVCQAGAGSIIEALKHDKPLIMTPRLKIFGENYNDHQQQLARAVSAQGRAIVLENITGDSLLEAISSVTNKKAAKVESLKLMESLRYQLKIWSAKKLVSAE